MIARRTKAVTVTGTLLDPIADKLLDVGGIHLARRARSRAGLDGGGDRRAGVRGFGVATGGSPAGVIIAANWWGKLKTLSQIVAVSLLIVSYQLGPWALLARVALWVALAMTVASLVSYFGGFWRRVVGAER